MKDDLKLKLRSLPQLDLIRIHVWCSRLPLMSEKAREAERRRLEVKLAFLDKYKEYEANMMLYGEVDPPDEKS